MTSPTGGRPRVAVLGGGIASLTTAWRLCGDDRIGEITVYQRGWRLGGKGASSRGENGRIEEHGLHVWLGYYDNAFRLIREVYSEIDRPTTRPDCPISEWTDAFAPAPHVGLMAGGTAMPSTSQVPWTEWTALFSHNDEVPGAGVIDDGPMGPVDFVERSLTLVLDYIRSLDSVEQGERGRVILTASPRPPSDRRDIATLAQRAVDVVTAVVFEVTHVSVGAAERMAGGALPDAIDVLETLRESSARWATRSDARRRLFELVDVVTTTVRGILADGLLTDPRGFSAINNEEYTDWLRRHGAADESFASPLVRGVYDLVFGYEGGEPTRPMFAAGTAVLLGSKIFFDYKGSIFWKMQAGMGDVVFAPLYEALRARGVRFEFFHQVEELCVDETGEAISSVVMTRQAHIADGRSEYEPLRCFDELPCFPAAPDGSQLKAGWVEPDDVRSLEQLWGADAESEHYELRHGEDFDVLVYGLSVGMVPFTCGQLLARDQRWRDMADRLGTVATQAFQLWLHDDEVSLGWQRPGSTVTGYVKPFDTVASMSHLLRAEQWGGDDVPSSVFYFCNTMPEPPPPDATATAYPVDQHARVRRHAVEFLETHGTAVLPGAKTAGRFDWAQLVDRCDRVGDDRFDSQFWTANVDPSDRYVQSLPGTDRFRLRADASGFDHLFLTGDWTDCGLNAGCIEAAVISGLQTANAVLGDRRWSGISGDWRLLGDGGVG